MVVACKFQWGLLGPFNLSGLAMTFLFALLHALPTFINNSRYALHLVKLALVADFMVSVVLALGSFMYFVGESDSRLSSSFVFVNSLGTCLWLTRLLEHLSEPT